MSLYPEDDDNYDKINKEHQQRVLNSQKSNVDPNLNIQHNNPSIEEREAQQKRNAVLSLVNDVKSQREDIDKITNIVTYLAEQMQKFASVIDQQTAAINSLGRAPPAQAGAGMSQIGELLNSPLGEKLLNKLLPEDNHAPPLIDNSMIQEKMKQTFFDNLETGESINNFIKNSLKKSVTKNVINTSLAEIGRASNEHEPG